MENFCAQQNLGVIAYYALAGGFLTGEYRSKADLAGSARIGTVSGYLNPNGCKLLDAPDAVAARHDATPAQVALAWLIARSSVTAPIASATNVKQLAGILKSADLELSLEDFSDLDL